MPEANYGLEVRYTLRAFTRALTTLAASVELTAAEFRVLRTLDDGLNHTQAELAVLTAMDRPYVTSLVKKMIARGLLSVSASATDRRRVDITLTEEGRRISRHLFEQADLVNRDATEGVDAAALETFLAVLRRLRANLAVYDPSAPDDSAASDGASQS